MSKKGFVIFCASVFIFIFSAKMIISVAPLFAGHFDSEYINGVIMQIEIENHSKSSDFGKEKFGKEFWQTAPGLFSFSVPLNLLSSGINSLKNHNHLQSFYPAVPTPPPNS